MDVTMAMITQCEASTSKTDALTMPYKSRQFNDTPVHLQNINPHAMLEHERARWQHEQDMLLAHLEQALHWQQSADAYDQCLQKYYIQRAKHQQLAVRLNQVLYGQSISVAMQEFQGNPSSVEFTPLPTAMCVSPERVRQALQLRAHANENTNGQQLVQVRKRVADENFGNMVTCLTVKRPKHHHEAN